MQIFPFRPEFASDVFGLILPIQQLEFGIPIGAEDQPDLADIPAFYQQGKGNFWVATDHGKVVGSAALLDIGSSREALRKMFVHKDYRGGEHGTATRLLGTLLEWAAREGVQDIYLGTTDKFLAAHRFYEKHGFRELARASLPPGFPVMKVDTKFYELSLRREAV